MEYVANHMFEIILSHFINIIEVCRTTQIVFNFVVCLKKALYSYRGFWDLISFI